MSCPTGGCLCDAEGCGRPAVVSSTRHTSTLNGCVPIIVRYSWCKVHDPWRAWVFVDGAP